MLFARYGLRNVRRRGRESLLVGVAVFIASNVLLTQLAQRHGVERRARRVLVGALSGDYLVVRRTVPPIDVLSSQFDEWPRFVVPSADASSIGAPAGLQVSPRLRFGALLAHGDRSMGLNVQAVPPDQLSRLSSALELDAGGIDTTDASALLLSDPVCQYLACHVGDTLVILATNRDGYMSDDLLVVRGIFSSRGVATFLTGTAYVPYARGHALLGLAAGETMELVVARRDPTATPAPGEQEALDAALARVNPDLVASPWSITAPLFHAIIVIWRGAGVVTQIVFGALSFLLLLNVVLAKVFGRRREIGTLLALGYAPLRVTSLVVFEYLVVTWGGLAASLVVVGSALAVLHQRGIPVGSVAMEAAYLGRRLYPQLLWTDVVWVVVLFTLVTVIGVTLPMLRFRRIAPSTLLRTST